MLINTIISYWKTQTNFFVNPILNELATNSWKIKWASNKFLKDRKENKINNKRVKLNTENGESMTFFLTDEFSQPCQICVMTLISQGRELRQRSQNHRTNFPFSLHQFLVLIFSLYQHCCILLPLLVPADKLFSVMRKFF